MKEFIDFIERWLGHRYPRGMGNPARGNSISGFHIAQNALDINDFAEANNWTNVYTSVYAFSDYTNPATDGHKAIIDTIPFDFDSKNLQAAKIDAMKLVSWCIKHDIQPRITFSGSKGFHVMIDIVPTQLINPKRSLQQFSNELSDAAGFTTIDRVIFGDTNRLIRIPNTLHAKSNLYCIPLTVDDIQELSLDEIMYMARQQNFDDIKRINNKHTELVSNLLDIDANMQPETDYRLIPNKASKLARIFENRPIGPCRAVDLLIAYGIDEGARDLALTGIIRYYTLRGLSADEIMKKCLLFDSHCDKPMRRANIKYKVDYHMKKDYTPCAFLSKIGGICNGCSKIH